MPAPDFEILIDGTILIEGRDLSPQISASDPQIQVEIKEVNNFAGRGWKTRVGAIASAQQAISGFYRADDAPTLFQGLGAQLSVAMVDGNPAEAGARAYLLKGVSGKFPFGGKIGELQEVNLEFSGGRLYLGALLDRVAGVSVGAGGEQTLGAIPSGKSLVLCVQAEVETSLGLVLESNATGGGSGDWVSRATLAFTETAALWAVIPGPITDTRFRVRRSAVSGDATFHALTAIA